MAGDSAARVDRILEDLEHFGVKLGLERMRAVLAELGAPERELPVVLVAGTNGKGSTSAWIASIATAAGYRSGLFTSPHLERVEERLRIDGRAIEIEELEALLVEVLAASQRAASQRDGGEMVTYFEAMTASALCHFSRQGVDLAVLEVGLGGRLDATNVTTPRLSVITQISYDHQRQLGDTLGDIAAEKAGILRAGRPAVSSATDPSARAAISRVAAAVGADLAFVDGAVALSGSSGSDALDLRPRLTGEHQMENLALAVSAALRLREGGFPAIDAAAIERGVAACRWPGRLEGIALDQGREVLLDAAHNPGGLEALLLYLRSVDRPFGLVFGMLREKVDPEVVQRVWGSAERVWVTCPESERALSPEDLVALVGRKPDAVVEEPGEALASALEVDDLVVVCGSRYLVGALRGWLRSEYGVPPLDEGLFVLETAGHQTGGPARRGQP